MKNKYRKKILHITYDMRIGGTEMVIKNLIEGENNSLFEQSILCIEAPVGPFGEMLKEKMVTIDVIPRQDGFDATLIKKIRHYIKRHKIDILHCHQYTPWVYGVLAAAFSNVKVIFTEHGRFYPDSSSWKRKIINPLLMLFTDHCTAISEATKQALVDFESIPKNRIEVVYNGIIPLIIDIKKVEELRQKYNIPTDTKILGTIARLDPIKNQTMMLRAFSQVLESYSNALLFIIGDGEEREVLENLVDELSIRKNIIFTGYIAQPADYLQMMDIFLLSSLSEGTSMTLLEAMSLSKPCVVTDAGGNPEIIKHQINGFVTENNNVEQYAQAIIKSLSNLILLKKMGLNAKTQFTERFENSIMLEKYHAIYNNINP